MLYLGDIKVEFESQEFRFITIFCGMVNGQKE